MPKDVTLRPFCLWLGGLLLLPAIVSTDVTLYKWLGLGSAAFSFTAAGWFGREVWQSKQADRDRQTHTTTAARPDSFAG